MPRRAMSVCTGPGCPAIVEQPGRCAACRSKAEAKRGNFRQRGYRRGHEKRFRRGVLRRDINCVLCIEAGRWVPATVADHWPLSRRELVERGMDPDDPANGRGLCGTCHNRSTAREQPGGWNAR